MINFLNEVLNQLRNLIIALSISYSSFTSGEGNSLSPQPTLEVEVVSHDSSPYLIATPTATMTVAVPTVKPLISPSKRPTPTLVSNIDINLESVSLIAERYEGGTGSTDEYLSKMHSGDLNNITLKQPNGIKRVVVRVRNNGTEDAKNVVVKFIVDGNTLTQYSIDILEKQSAKSENKEIKLPGSVGTHKLEVQINPEKTLIESKYDNNSKVVEYTYVN